MDVTELSTDQMTDRSWAAINWIAHTAVPMWLDLVPSLATEAAALRALPTVTIDSLAQSYATINDARFAARRVLDALNSRIAWQPRQWDAPLRYGRQAAYAATETTLAAALATARDGESEPYTDIEYAVGAAQMAAEVAAICGSRATMAIAPYAKGPYPGRHQTAAAEVGAWSALASTLANVLDSANKLMQQM